VLPGKSFNPPAQIYRQDSGEWQELLSKRMKFNGFDREEIVGISFA
jgi:hypothetical protein